MSSDEKEFYKIRLTLCFERKTETSDFEIKGTSALDAKETAFNLYEKKIKNFGKWTSFGYRMVNKKKLLSWFVDIINEKKVVSEETK